MSLSMWNVAGLLLAPLCWAGEGESANLELADGDRVVFVGAGLIEREQQQGWLESFLSARWPDRNVTFRNLGWSGDTVGGVSRSGFDPPEAGYPRLLEQVRAAKPTILIIGYGDVESHEGEAGLARFREGLARLLGDLAKEPVRAVALLSPAAEQPNETRGADWLARRERDIALYSAAIREAAQARGFAFVDLAGPSASALLAGRQSALHLDERGSLGLATLVTSALLPREQDQRVAIRLKDGRSATAEGAEGIQVADGGLSFRIKPALLPRPALADGEAEHIQLVVEGLAPGKYLLKVGGKEILEADADAFAKGVALDAGLWLEQWEALREVIRGKNEQFFFRWRPQNETYLFGFRKHEQGQNAAEIPKFDPIVERREQEIARLRQTTDLPATLSPVK